MSFRLPHFTPALLLLLAAAGTASSADPVPLPADSRGALVTALRAGILQLLPNPLYEASPGWGQTRRAAVGLRWEGHGLLRNPQVSRSPRNDGLWRKVRISAINLPGSFSLDVRDIRQDGPRLLFSVFVSLDVRAEIEQQRWEAGVRLYSTSVTARLRAKLRLDCEAEATLEFKDMTLPDAVIRFRVVRADLGYDNLVTEHAAGVGGTAARFLGEAVRSGVRRFAPAVERVALEHAGAAIVRAGQTREVRISLGRLLKGAEAPAGEKQSPP